MPRTNNSLFGLRWSLFSYHNSQSTSMSSSLSSISERSGAASSTSDSVTSANGSVAREAVRACWMDARRSCPAWQGWPSFRQWSKNLQEVTGRTSSPAWNLWNLLYIAPLRRLLSGILQLKIWTMISLLYSGARYGSVQFMFSNGKLCELSRTFKIVNRQFIQ